jgi:hypothetical protein
MNTQSPPTPILSEQGLLLVFAGLFLIIIFAGASFGIIFRRNPTSVREYRGGRALHYVTVVAIVFSTIILGLERVLAGEAVASLLGGIIGYVLGTLKQKTEAQQNVQPQEAPH